MNLNTKHIKGTPYRVVISNKMIVGVFDKEKFYDNNGMSAKHKEAVSWYIAQGEAHAK